METIIKKSSKNKFILLCAWCFSTPEEQQVSTKKYEKLGYRVSHGMCSKKKCLDLFSK